MGESYRELKKRQSEQMNRVFEKKVFFAFNQDQFREGMKKIGATSESELLSMGAGGFYKKKDADTIRSLFIDQCKELEDRMAKNMGFDFDMFQTELANHEFIITMDLEETLDAVGLTLEEVGKNRNIYGGLAKALMEYDAELTPEAFGVRYVGSGRKAVMEYATALQQK